MEDVGQVYYHVVVLANRKPLTLINQKSLEPTIANTVQPIISGGSISFNGALLKSETVYSVHVYRTTFQITLDDLIDRMEAQDSDSVCAINDSDDITEEVFAKARRVPLPTHQNLNKTFRVLGGLVLAISILGIVENVSISASTKPILATGYLIAGILSIDMLLFGKWKVTGMVAILGTLGSIASIIALWLLCL